MTSSMPAQTRGHDDVAIETEPKSDVGGHIDIIDLGYARKVRIAGEAYSFKRYTPAGLEFETTYSAALLRDIARIKGTAWVKDEIDRADCPEYISGPLTRSIERFLPNPSGLTVLDIGSGSGSSSIILARLGMRVIAVEHDRDFHQLAVRRITEYGLSSQIENVWIERTADGFPYVSNSFNVILLNAVMEHVHPDERTALLRHAWRVLKPGGHLFIHDTPNRVWPFDGHTTGLWFTNWLPWTLRVRYARRFSSRFPPDTTEAALIAKGLHPPTFWELQHALPDGLCLNGGNDVTFAFGVTDSAPRSLAKSALRSVVIQSLKSCGWLIERTGTPAAAILQNLDLCFRKVTASPPVTARRNDT
jgi:2-polyprenyl-3-methyl-5-hydroxy-6-metoxy-1,4-benzoquinol methylase